MRAVPDKPIARDLCEAQVEQPPNPARRLGDRPFRRSEDALSLNGTADALLLDDPWRGVPDLG
jgi:hypothetical protein